MQLRFSAAGRQGSAWRLGKRRCVRASQGFPYKKLFYPTAIVVTSAMALLQLRTYALYNKSKAILYAFGVVNLAAAIVFIIEDITFTKFNYSREHRKYFGVQTSGWSSGTSYSPFFWATFSFNEAVTFALVLYKAWQLYSSRSNQDNHGTRTIIDIVIRDNIIYFSVMLITCLSGFLLCLDTQLLSSAASTHLLVSIAVSGMLAPNLYLDLKRKYYAHAEEPYYTTFSTAFEAAPGASIQSIEMSTPDEWEGHEE
ncbi:uncharacterized protein FOMMEDRAFT_159690 [Fomitiporia mediterranea MF3/22]|uniref:uncharacterized protein n=1 Tax=Fomitiporia mediterranea (strain MF3/22) TaxID=694068 RepID=UPI0004408284|nr:uncharacterized protein FOMMEDRAFT_159690 [Fomitiporia mediterranea MF3/22]EJD00078.1 hypothetical protein FOMMEDRAFT_159690 [Fomitiporia mediterranea MF3/22]